MGDKQSFSREMINANIADDGSNYVYHHIRRDLRQLADPCDEFQNIPPNGFVADWQNVANDLSDSSDDCETMTLSVFVYPGYNGEAIQSRVNQGY